ncbi:MAG: substrate-binding domain-containing protein [Clostridia bacterium]|nr:substrate-binding domain-containing protein [Clostridia bacterium]
MKRFLVALLGMILIVGVCYGVYTFLTKDAGETPTPNPNISEQENNNPNGNENQAFVIGQAEAIFTEENYPRIDGSTATIPLSEAFKAEFLGKGLNDVSVVHNTTHNAYVNLVDGNADLILVTYPSEEELQYAKDQGVDLEIVPVVNEAFVFYTNEKNPVKSLTLEQIQKIYTGEITNWSEVGGNDVEIKAYQREPNSGSQTGMLKLVMNGLELMEPPKEDIIETMAAIIGLVSDYENGENAIGYSYYYYATTMYDTIDKEVADRIHLLGVNGVEPNNTTIKDGSYPIRTNYYLVYNKAEAEDSPVRKLADAMLSENGQKAAEAVGYVGVK